jgi:hypothetical protein
VASEGKLINVVDQFVIWEGEIGERHKQSMKQNTKTKNTNLTSNKTQPWWTQTQQSNWNKICGSNGYMTAEDMNFFLAFLVDLGMKTGNKLKDTQVYLTGNPKSGTTW